MELWDIYDSNRQKTGRTHTRGVPLPDGDYHLVVHVWIVNDKGEFLIQQRQPWKQGAPNMWDCAAAGSAIAGDDSRMAAIRETKEELGIDLDIDKGRIILTDRFADFFDDNWIVRQNIGLHELNLQYEEVQDAKWTTEDEIRQMVENGIFIPYDYLNKIFEYKQML